MRPSWIPPVPAGAVQQDHRRAGRVPGFGDTRRHAIDVDPPLAELNLSQPGPQAAVFGLGVVQHARNTLLPDVREPSL